MAKCNNCGLAFCVYGGSKGSTCSRCGSKDIDISMEPQYLKNNMEEDKEE